MEPSKHKKQTRGVFDVHKTASSSRFDKIAHHFKSPHVINLRPKLRKKHPWLVSAGSVAIVLLLLLGVRKIFTRAEVADFYPATCLGTWQNPQHAQGQPETFEYATSSAFTGENSAVLLASPGEIFCGGFVTPEYESKGEIQNIGLTLAWHIEGIPSPTISNPEPVIDSNVTSSTDITPTQEGAPQENTQQNSTSTTLLLNRNNFSLRDLIFTPVFAQETDPALDVSGENQVGDALILAPHSDSSMPPEQQAVLDNSSTTIIMAPISAVLEDASTTQVLEETTMPSVSSTTEVILPPPAPDENFLLVSYSTDGQNWIDIQKVNSQNWENLTVILPIKTWDDLKKLQIRVKGIDTTLDPLPSVYLDGMFVEAQYDLPSLLSLEDESKSNDLATALFPAPYIASSSITQEAAHLSIEFFGPFFDQSLRVFLYPAGTSAGRNGPDGSFAFSEAPQGPFLDAVQLYEKDFNENHLASFDIISPDANPDYGMRTFKMEPGIYSIDIAYFDGEMWRLTPPQNFTWPQEAPASDSGAP